LRVRRLYEPVDSVCPLRPPDGASTTTYSYQGNVVTVTDPAGKWKQYTTDAFGELTQVVEQGPGTDANHLTTYSYDLVGHLIQVQMKRTVNGNLVTQNRTWVYDPTTQRLTSKISPEAGTVTYTYNTDGTVATVTDAKSQQKKFTYDSYGRVTKISAPGQTITYSYGSSYDGTNTLGRVATINYSVGSHTVQEGYKYTSAGAVAAKGIGLDGNNPLNQGALIATYLYDGEGHLTSVAYPVANTTTWGAPAATYSYGLDAMGRLNTMTDQNNNTLVSGVTYSPANQILSLATSSFTETSTYNANLQLATLVSGSYSYQYNYVAGQNNGRVQSIKDNASGETVTYLYDSLNRLVQASGANDPHGSWSQQFTYDGFGNLTQKIGSNAPNNLTINVDPTTNRLTGNGAVYDANGNLTQYNNTLNNPTTYSYDSFNRLTGASGSSITYGYDASNQRVYSTNGTTETFFFYGADGKKLGVWTIPPLSGSFTLVSLNTWFGGRLLKPQDRLNSIGKYFPYGEDRYSPSPANPTNGQEKFATYTRDAETGLDYAYQRYYTAGLGRFMTPDPYKAAGASIGGVSNAGDPQSWNTYAYVEGDPINGFDPTGEFLMLPQIDWNLLWLSMYMIGPQQPHRVPTDPPDVPGRTHIQNKGRFTSALKDYLRNGLSKNCLNWLGGNLSALLTAASKINFYDATTDPGNVYMFGDPNGSPSDEAGDFAAVNKTTTSVARTLRGPSGAPTYNVVVFGDFYGTADAATDYWFQAETLAHEFVHAYKKKDDVQLDQTLELKPPFSGANASTTFDMWFSGGCNPRQTNPGKM
jgi:RHS repeat-associated protein